MRFKNLLFKWEIVCVVQFVVLATKKRKLDEWERLRDKKIEIQQIIEISQKQWISTGGLLIR